MTKGYDKTIKTIATDKWTQCLRKTNPSSSSSVIKNIYNSIQIINHCPETIELQAVAKQNDKQPSWWQLRKNNPYKIWEQATQEAWKKFHSKNN